MTDPIKVWGGWSTNAHLIADVAKLGYLQPTDHVLDPTYGYGTFWKVWRPDILIGTDGASGFGVPVMNVRNMPWADQEFDVTVYDPPYKLNGTTRPQDRVIDERYGVHEKVPWEARMELIWYGTVECCRVSSRHVLVKCQDQVVSGKKRWQTTWVTEAAEQQGWGLVDRFEFPSYRPQPMEGRTQRTAHVCSSQLLVFSPNYEWKPKIV